MADLIAGRIQFYASCGVSANADDDSEIFDTYEEAAAWCAEHITSDNQVRIESTEGW